MIETNASGTVPYIPTELTDEARRFFSIDRLKNNYGTCVICHSPIRTVHVPDIYGDAACQSHDPKICWVCGHIIIGNRVFVDGSQRPICINCGTPLKKGDLKSTIAKLLRHYTNHKFLIPRFTLNLLTAKQIVEKHGSLCMGMAILTYDEQNNTKTYTIDLMSQQSPTSALSTLAHEMLHLFMYARDYALTGGNGTMHERLRPIKEGFCNLGSYVALCELADKTDPEVLHHLSNLMEDHDASYGQGFRRMKLLYDTRGWEACVAVLREFSPLKQH